MYMYLFIYKSPIFTIMHELNRMDLYMAERLPVSYILMLYQGMWDYFCNTLAQFFIVNIVYLNVIYRAFVYDAGFKFGSCGSLYSRFCKIRFRLMKWYFNFVLKMRVISKTAFFGNSASECRLNTFKMIVIRSHLHAYRYKICLHLPSGLCFDQYII